MILFSILVNSVLNIDVQCLVLEDDGTEIEYDAVLEAFKGCTLIALSEGETWKPKGSNLNIDRVNYTSQSSSTSLLCNGNIGDNGEKCDNGDKSELPSSPHILPENEEPIQSLSRATQGETDEILYFEKKCLMINGT